MCLPQVRRRHHAAITPPSRLLQALLPFRALQQCLDVFPFRYLYGFEEYCTSTAITFRMDLPLKQGAKGEVKPEGDAGVAAPPSSSGEQAGLPGAGTSKAPYVLCKVPSSVSGFVRGA